MWRISVHPFATTEARATLDRALALIAEAPDRWPELPNGRRRYALRRFPFILVYCIRVDDVRILAVQHGRRRPGYWKHRDEVGLVNQ